MEIESLGIVFLLWPALYSKFSQDRDHLPERSPATRSLTEGGLAFLVSLNGKQDSPASDQVPNSLGQITPFFPCDCAEKS